MRIVYHLVTDEKICLLGSVTPLRYIIIKICPFSNTTAVMFILFDEFPRLTTSPCHNEESRRTHTNRRIIYIDRRDS
jgi:hypothetical protein